MAEHEEDRKASTISKRKKESPPFVEVICDRTKKTWRFAAGTEAKFAVKMINSKLDSRYQLSPGSHIEAVKDGEESVIFGPNAVLVNYGDAWSLRIATDPAGLGKAKQDNTVVMGQAYHPPTMGLDYQLTKRTSQGASKALYIGKILLAFMFIFLLGAIFTLMLESLPKLSST
ncbi:uncharacterized protein LOC115998529 [Ipomoea triloba]|uniref:uncharacterized protein LOC115998529 n=1 Tax=Ipomoea triloba TaxID=35885 RepID=UPI00125DB951|nr:uncharacterized protein LOC115998529 [Ipomoea triloba]